MQLHYTERFRRSYASAPPNIQRAFDRRVAFLVKNLRHPSLRAKKYDEARNIWQARVNSGWRFYFTIEDDTYHIIDIIPHPK
jgi:mRNA-degrading endonuclease RelE of RelBE toxin-antitoxin system